jgi:hypothetical protein
VSLDLSKTALLSPEERAQFKSAEGILEEVEERAEELGLMPYPKPTSVPESLADIDIEALTNPGLGQLFTRYTAYGQYVFGELTKSEVAYKIGVSSLKLVEAKLKTKYYGLDGITKAEVPALVKDDAFRIEYELEVLKLYAMKEILGAHYKAYSKQADALSRIISLRELEFDRDMRRNSIDSRKKQGPPLRDFRRG